MRFKKTQPESINSGFTLLELLIAISVIGILMLMTLTVMNGVTNQARSEATRATINKISRLLEQRMEAFERAFKGDRREAYVKSAVGLLTAIDARFDHFARRPDQATGPIVILAKKAAFRSEFPQRMAELILTPAADTNGNQLQDVIEQAIAAPAARAAIKAQRAEVNDNTEPTLVEIQALVDSRWQKHLDSRNAGTDKTESSELLYFALVVSGTFGASPVDADQFSTNEVADTDQDGLPEFIDAWGEPLRYYRWPTRLVDPTAPNPFNPDFATLDDRTEIDPSPILSENDRDFVAIDFTTPLPRRILRWERRGAAVLLKGLPPAPIALPVSLGGSPSTQRDLLFVDPDDPVGLLYSLIEDPQLKSLNIDVTAEFNEAKYHTPDTYHAPLIVSAGSDRLVGLREPYDTNPAAGVFGNLAQYADTVAPDFGTNTDPLDDAKPSAEVVDQLFDNITNRNTRAGGSR
jgi:prepilin-type N-terminal cleavage/methylation domain-containing protein